MARKYYQGKYKPRHPEKYAGDVTNIVYRSSWELKLFNYCDQHPQIIKWGSEEVVIPYRYRIDGKVHRYFVDVFMVVQNKDGSQQKILIEVKPHAQTLPPKKPQRITESYTEAAKTYVKNQDKWAAAREFCERRGWKFVILTEKQLYKKR